MLAGLVFLTGLGLLAWFGYSFFGTPSSPPPDAEATDTASGVSCEYRSSLNGACTTQEGVSARTIGVMIENHVDARPQAGLVKASIVYEVPVEANITRFLALYPSTEIVEKAGPVRSARPYYLEWLSEYGDALYMHVGGSPEALDKIEAYDVFDLNEMTRGWYFWRADERSAPHNTYTSSKLWTKALKDYPRPANEVFDSWSFADDTDPACSEDCVASVRVVFDTSAYEVEWRYVSSTRQYQRYQSGRPHQDEDGTPIFADTVIVQHANVTVIDDIGRRSIETAGSGSAAVFRDGYGIEGSWEKRGRSGRTMWRTEDGTDIPLRAGKIWVEVVGRNNRVTTVNAI